jgi:hypothetical protein
MVPGEVLLQAWERGRSCGAHGRALELLRVALPGCDGDVLAAFDPGLCDWHLLRLRLAWFGSYLEGHVDCPGCGERLEIAFDVSARADDEPPAPPLFTASDGRRFRLIRLGDLTGIGAAGDAASAAQALFIRCSLDESRDAGTPDPLFGEVDAGLAALASARALSVSVSCALCGRQSEHSLDAAEFLWSEICAAAAVVLDDVHRLARAYGWPERDILGMSAARRDAYLERVE